jgi:methionyl-tRNA formyltransferase
MGNNQRGIACLRALHNSRHDVIYAVAQTGEKGWYSSVIDTAKELDIPVSIENKPNSAELLDKLEALAPDLIVMCGYSKIVGQRLRGIPENGCVNLHAGWLPNYRGAAPLNWALINGEKKIGLSILYVDDGIDTGPIISQRTIDVSVEDTIREVLQKTLDIYPGMLLQVCDNIENGSVTATPQNPDCGSYYTKRRPQDGVIDWTSITDFQIYNLVRALTHPYPGAFFYYEGKRVFVWEAELEKRDCYGCPGRIAARRNGGIVVICQNRGLRLTRVQMDGKEEVAAAKLFTRVGVDLIDRG